MNEWRIAALYILYAIFDLNWLVYFYGFSYDCMKQHFSLPVLRILVELSDLAFAAYFGRS